jgi:anti-sigma regulatory factor (Ser/Thr protein kinase)
VSSPEGEATGATRDPPGPSCPADVPPATLDGQAGTQNPLAGDAIVTTGEPGSAAPTDAAETSAATRNPGAATATVTTADTAGMPAGAAPASPDGAQEAVLVLQRHLLPSGLPIFPQVRLAGRHLVASRAPGGGCFDAFALPGGTIALMAGHAPGHGPQAVAAMAELSTVLRQALRGGADLPEALNRMDEFAASSPTVRGAAASLALLDPATGSVHYASAGYPLPLVCGLAETATGGTVSLLLPTGGKPLGLGAGQPAVAVTELAPGAMLLLGGDGADGGQDGHGRPGAERFAAAASAVLAGGGLSDGEPSAAEAADLMCAAVAERLADGEGAGDVTVLAAHRLREPGGGLSLRLPTEAHALRQLRARLAEWLTEVGAAPPDRVDTELAVYEAAANAIMHGRPARGPGMVAVDVVLDGTGGTLIQVADQGQWQERSAAGSEDRTGGRGLAVISKVTSELSITPSPTGTTVIMRRPLTHPVTVGRVPAH